MKKLNLGFGSSAKKDDDKPKKLNWNFGFGSKKASDSQGDGEVSEQHQWTNGASLTTKAIVGLLWVALIAGPLALIWNFMSADAEVPVVNTQEEPGEVAAVSEFAERAVVAWLETKPEDSEQLEQYFGETSGERPEIPWKVSRPSVADVEQTESGLWKVVVGVDVTEGKNPDQKQPDEESGTETPRPTGKQRLYFEVPVLSGDGAMVAQALPAPSDGYVTPEQVETAYEFDLGADSQATETVAGFLNAKLTSAKESELKLYIHPSASFTVADPPQYAQVVVNRVAADVELQGNATPVDGETIEVLVSANLIGFNEQALPAQYFLRLQARDGRWEVLERLPVPTLASAVPSNPRPESVDNDSTQDNTQQTQEDTPVTEE